MVSIASHRGHLSKYSIRHTIHKQACLRQRTMIRATWVAAGLFPAVWTVNWLSVWMMTHGSAAIRHLVMGWCVAGHVMGAGRWWLVSWSHSCSISSTSREIRLHQSNAPPANKRHQQTQIITVESAHSWTSCYTESMTFLLCRVYVTRCKQNIQIVTALSESWPRN